ncbi:MAG: hypothetical protein BWZ06_01346 [Bacteroidetes bacterium ADurb.BinA261]|nr:MAG: hypothetical protein BWZ06_01346 [Bacteroidetes bacterium ADurb.BinA261]
MLCKYQLIEKKVGKVSQKQIGAVFFFFEFVAKIVKWRFAVILEAFGHSRSINQIIGFEHKMSGYETTLVVRCAIYQIELSSYPKPVDGSLVGILFGIDAIFYGQFYRGMFADAMQFFFFAINSGYLHPHCFCCGCFGYFFPYWFSLCNRLSSHNMTKIEDRTFHASIFCRRCFFAFIATYFPCFHPKVL